MKLKIKKPALAGFFIKYPVMHRATLHRLNQSLKSNRPQPADKSATDERGINNHHTYQLIYGSVA